jgi:hypothetical protein
MVTERYLTSIADIPRLDDREELFLIPGPREGMSLFLRRLTPFNRSAERAVLYIHVATFPSALSIAYRFDGRSWRDALCDAGFSVWGLDFYGFGYSDRYPEMSQPADVSAPLGRAAESTDPRRSFCGDLASLARRTRLRSRPGASARLLRTRRLGRTRDRCGRTLAFRRVFPLNQVGLASGRPGLLGHDVFKSIITPGKLALLCS